MKTLRLDANKPADVQLAGELLQAGELVAVPTETVYGLAADASNPEAVAKIFKAKGRPTDHPLITHIGSFEQLANWAADIPEWVESLTQCFWPGPLTLIFERHPNAPDVITGGLQTIGIRMPAHPVLLELLRNFNMAIAAPSANPYQKLSPTSAEQVMACMDGKIAAVLDGGNCMVGTESTILKVSQNRAQILRSGPISEIDLAPHLTVPVVTPEKHQYSVSGNKKRHYQPDARIMLLSAQEIATRAIPKNSKVGVMAYSPELKTIKCHHLSLMPNDHQSYRKRLFAALYEMDCKGCNELWIEAPPTGLSWLDIWDRLTRAAQK
ncbi:L-threonylcarbamoyladenylate synthase [Kangiella aquimarina]|uniref:Threonylcarbamoyl-AMP synthase n=1 Tax=Kangiella aquimarina TaxID=261965 RepID=A0ABZ0X5M3_9GAMM|nr:L-threonylcarbamoyladenylate synthase [Kangiella aquimarina]WQG85830.1 L-threonylcarbamoyladenylate synthase [Kangiella aquimarina]